MAAESDPTVRDLYNADLLAAAAHDIHDAGVVDRFISEYTARNPETARFVLEAIRAANGIDPHANPKYAFIRGAIFSQLVEAGLQEVAQLEQMLIEPAESVQPNLFELDSAA